MRQPVKAAAILGAVVVAVVATLAVSVRWQVTPVLTGIRKFNRVVTNPGALRTAGSDSSGTAVIHHVGRRSGRSYRTPVTAERIGTGFVIGLPYGTTADWVRNVLASGGALLETGGRQVMTRNAVVVPTGDVSAELPRAQRQALRLLGVSQCLRLDVVTP